MFEFDGSTYTLTEMLEANAHDAAFCEWARMAKIGEDFCGCVRIS